MLGNFLTLPLLFVSSAQLPITLLPDWMQTIARINPVSYAINAIRLLLNGPAAGSDRAPATVVLRALVILLALTAITATMATRSFRRTVT